MWTRELLKTNAKEALRRYYWPAFLVCLVTALLCGGAGGASGSSGMSIDIDLEEIQEVMYRMNWEMLWPFFTRMAVFAGIAGTIGAIVQIFIGNVLTVGSAEFFLVSRNRGEAAPLESMLKGFRTDYGKVVLTLFLRDLFIMLWSMLFVIPGIVKTYEYLLIPYILADYPEISREEAFAMSKHLMDGHKMEAFVLGLSFIGWQLLGALCCGVGVYFVAPYVEATYAEFYTALKETTPM